MIMIPTSSMFLLLLGDIHLRTLFVLMTSFIGSVGDGGNAGQGCVGGGQASGSGEGGGRRRMKHAQGKHTREW